MELTQTQHHQKLIDLAFALVRSTSFTSIEASNTVQRSALVSVDDFNRLFEYLHKECPKPVIPALVVTVEGGTVIDISAGASHKDLQAVVRDMDNIKAGDADPLDGDTPEEAGYPHQIGWCSK